MIDSFWKELSTGQQKSFKKFVSRKHHKSGRSDLEYLNKIPSKNTSNREAAIRKRLKKELILYLSVLMSDEHYQEISDRHTLNAAQFLFDHTYDKEAWKLLTKIEKEASDTHSFQLLNDLYLLMIRHYSDQAPWDIETLITKKREAEEHMKEEQDIMINLALIKSRLSKQLATGQDEFDSVRSILDTTIQDKHLYQHPSQTLDLMEIVRNAMLTQRNLTRLPEFITPIYTQVFDNEELSPSFIPHKCRALYILSHALYRNQNYQACESRLKELIVNAQVGGKRTTRVYLPKAIALRTAILFLQGDLKDATERLENFLNDSVFSAHEKDLLNLRLTLITLLSCQNRPKNALKQAYQFSHSDTYYVKKMGRDWVMRKNVILSMAQYDSGRDDIALQMVKKVQNHFNDMFDLPYYQLVGPFLILLQNYFTNPHTVSIDQLDQLENQLKWSSGDTEIKKLAYYCWLRGKVKNQDFYTEMLQMLNEMNLAQKA